MKIEEKTQVKVKEKNANPTPSSQTAGRQASKSHASSCLTATTLIGYTWDCPALEIEAAKGLIFAKMDAPEQHW